MRTVLKNLACMEYRTAPPPPGVIRAT
jgi:hypothetical protein